MSWTYFTTYLDGTRPITKAERDEVLDQFIAKLTSCTSAYPVDATALAAVKGSGLVSMKLLIYTVFSIYEITDPYNWTAQTTLLATVPPFANHPSAITTACSDEGITEINLQAFLAADLDSYHVWNVLKRWLDYLVCIPTTSLTCRSKSATKTKCGFGELTSPSTPPKRYLTKEQSGTLSDATGGAYNGTLNIYGGSIDYDSVSCAATDSSLMQIVDTVCGCSFTLTGAGAHMIVSGGGFTGYVDIMVGGYPSCSCNAQIGGGSPSFGPGSVTQTSASFAATAGYSGTGTYTLSNEYTTALLSTNVDAALAAASFGAYTTCVDAIYTRTSDELTIAKRAVDVKVTFSAALSAAMALRYDIYNRTGGVLVSNNCVNLSAGATNYVISIGAPPNVGDAYYVTNVTLTPGTC